MIEKTVSSDTMVKESIEADAIVKESVKCEKKVAAGCDLAIRMKRSTHTYLQASEKKAVSLPKATTQDNSKKRPMSDTHMHIITTVWIRWIVRCWNIIKAIEKTTPEYIHYHYAIDCFIMLSLPYFKNWIILRV
jgi:sugar-specific transcriptional regulator TrmB